MINNKNKKNLYLISLFIALFIFVILVFGALLQFLNMNPTLTILSSLFIIPLWFLIIAFYGIKKRVTFPYIAIEIFVVVIGITIGAFMFKNIFAPVIGAIIGYMISLFFSLGLKKTENSFEIFADRIGWFSIILGVISLIYLIYLIIAN